MGSLATADWDNVPVILPIMILAILIFWTQYRKLNLMLLGDETAITLGTDLHKARIAYMLLSSFMVGFAVCAAGMIGFVGLIIPHAMRMLFGTDHKRLIPLSASYRSNFSDLGGCGLPGDPEEFRAAHWYPGVSDRRPLLYLSDGAEILWIWR